MRSADRLPLRRISVLPAQGTPHASVLAETAECRPPTLVLPMLRRSFTLLQALPCSWQAR